VNQIVWVFGNAAVGKETFIRLVAGKKDKKLLHDLGWQDAGFHIVEESIEWVAYDNDHSHRGKRDTLPEVIRKKAESSLNKKQVFLIKGQFVDLEAHRPEKTVGLLPSEIHRVLYLDAPPEDMFERLQKKPWVKESFTISRVKKLLRYEINMLKKLDSTISLTVVESGNSYQYKIKEISKNISQYI